MRIIGKFTNISADFGITQAYSSSTELTTASAASTLTIGESSTQTVRESSSHTAEYNSTESTNSTSTEPKMANIDQLSYYAILISITVFLFNFSK